MSQEKVDLRKAAKAGRKTQNKKDKTKKTIGKIIIVVIIAALLVWIGYSVFSVVKNGKGDKNKEVNLNSLQNYMQEEEQAVNGTDEEKQTSEQQARELKSLKFNLELKRKRVCWYTENLHALFECNFVYRSIAVK